LTEIQASSEIETLNVNLQAGRVRVDLKPPAGTKAPLSIASTIATASVRGTSFEFDTRNLQVYDGTVIFKGTLGQGVPISAGLNISIGQNESAVNPISHGVATLRPQSPVGTEVNISPVTIPTGNETQPPVPPVKPEEPNGPNRPGNPGSPGSPSNPSNPGNPGNPGSGNDDNLGIEVEFVP
jgi:hypothetical protein